MTRQTYESALKLFHNWKQFPKNRRPEVATTYHQLGRVAEEQREWATAVSHYNQALAIYIDFNDRYSQASTYHQLGRVAEEQREWATAVSHYNQALALKIEFNDRYSQASTYHQLGMVAQEQREWATAVSHYNQALALFIEFNDRYSQAATYHQLGMVAQEQREWATAVSHYNQALALKIEFNDRYSRRPPTTSWAGWRRSKNVGQKQLIFTSNLVKSMPYREEWTSNHCYGQLKAGVAGGPRVHRQTSHSRPTGRHPLHPPRRSPRPSPTRVGGAGARVVRGRLRGRGGTARRYQPPRCCSINQRLASVRLATPRRW
ncbi:MAG: tetratricopeptide repeat protein [Chloroflexi bacterium]|nr:tetratricopeptide repeat protein [Chloroflexota bacterium]